MVDMSEQNTQPEHDCSYCGEVVPTEANECPARSHGRCVNTLAHLASVGA